MKTQIIMGGILVVVFGFFAHYYFMQNHNDEIDSKLIKIVSSEFNNLHLKTDGVVVYQQIRSNHNCNKSDIVVVNSSNMSTNEICTSILSSLSPDKWQPVRQWKKDKFCVDFEHSADKFRPSYIDTSLIAQDHLNKLYLRIKAYPKTASFTFMPVNEYFEGEIFLAATKHGNSFYYVQLEYQGDYDTQRYRCGESSVECECAYSTFFKSTIDEIRNSGINAQTSQ